jgi:drug/metabolite transporter superfamily protein YnfA
MNIEEKHLPLDPPSLEGAVLNRARKIIRQHSYDVASWPSPSPDRKRILLQISRSTEIVGRILDGIAHDHAAARRPSRFLVGIGRLLWSIVELASRNSLAGLAARYWLSLLLVAEALLVIGSYILGRVDVRSVAWELLAITLLFGALIEIAGIWIDNSTRLRSLIGIAAVLLVFGTIVLAVFGWPVAMQEFSSLGARVVAKRARLATVLKAGGVIVVALVAFLAGRYQHRIRSVSGD